MSLSLVASNVFKSEAFMISWDGLRLERFAAEPGWAMVSWGFLVDATQSIIEPEVKPNELFVLFVGAAGPAKALQQVNVGIAYLSGSLDFGFVGTVNFVGMSHDALHGCCSHPDADTRGSIED